MRPILLLLLLPALPVHAGVQSETVFFLQADGRSYLLERSIHSDSPTHRFHLDKQITLNDIRHISPARFEWDDQSDDEVNSLTFDAGGFTLIYPSRFSDAEVSQDSRGDFHYKSWDGTRNAAGLYGYWYSPGDFDQFTYTWIVPDNIELQRYRSNRQGTWTRRSNAISFYAEKVNNLTFEMSYRVRPAKGQTTDRAEPMKAVPLAQPESIDCPPVPSCAEVASASRSVPAGQLGDSDEDGIDDASDLCPGTRAGSHVDKVGCALDTDADGVPDGVDRCIATAEETAVDTHGCEKTSP